jgi:methyl-accepting chemotaxis protein
MIAMLLQANISDYGQWGIAGAIVFLVIVVLAFILRALPSWKEIRLAEISVREKEAEARAAQATSFGQLSDALKSMSDVLNNVAVEQKHSTDKVQILQRVNADAVERNAESSLRSEEKIDRVLEVVEDLSSRVTSVEQVFSQK